MEEERGEIQDRDVLISHYLAESFDVFLREKHDLSNSALLCVCGCLFVCILMCVCVCACVCVHVCIYAKVFVLFLRRPLISSAAFALADL